MSEPFRAREVCDWTGAALLRGDAADAFSGVTIDSREVAAGQLFVAIAGPNHDGHDHVEAALSAGAGGCLIETGRAAPRSGTVLSVSDTTRALGDLAGGHRARHSGPLVGITGSNGKTSTKEMCASILECAGPCLKTRGNLNNQYGLPLTLLRRDATDRFAVVELGTNHPGEIARLAEIARPTIGVLNNVGTAHIEFLGSREGIAAEKGALIAALPADGVAVLNGDDPLVMSQAPRTRARIVRFGLSPEMDVRPDRLHWRDGGFAFALVAPQGQVDVHVAGLGEHTVSNALAASAAALSAGATLAQVATGLARHRAVKGRLAPLPLADDVLVIDDTYNANPQSLEVALRELTGGPACGTGRPIAVIGDMGELGDETDAAHRQAGALAARLGVEELYAVGDWSERVAEGARSAGMGAEHVHASSDWETAAESLAKQLRPGDRVLVKGSRAMRMERIVERIALAVGGAH
jgi:UDP-N-acetylmuramoyl-tripeptide--D-alanyl-D-alanine ligase